MRSARPLIAFFAGIVPVLFFLWPNAREPQHRDRVLHITEPIEWVALVGGVEPASTQVSLAQDLDLAHQVLGPKGIRLFGGGAYAFVQVTSPADASLRHRLARFFDPRDRDVEYVQGPDANGPAMFQTFLDVMDAAYGGEGPLWLYMGGHGESGEEPADALLRLWGGDALRVDDLARVLDSSPRPVRLVHTACFGGGFADMLFQRGDPERGPTDKDRCGVFATSWDEEASGCDPNPNRARQEGYALHFFRALGGTDRHGRPVNADLDQNGEVSMLEAHTRARIASRSMDVPTSTSERWLAWTVEQQDMELGGAAVELIEEDTVIAELGRDLGLSDEESAQRAFAELQLEMEEHEEQTRELELQADDAYYRLRIRLLERWPFLDDPWHPEHQRVVQEQRDEIERWFAHSDEAVVYAEAQTQLNRALERYDDLKVQANLRRRVVEAWDTLAFAATVHANDPRAWQVFERLRACERSPL